MTGTYDDIHNGTYRKAGYKRYYRPRDQAKAKEYDFLMGADACPKCKAGMDRETLQFLSHFALPYPFNEPGDWWGRCERCKIYWVHQSRGREAGEEAD